jgi:hypothetical protein
MKAAFQEKSPEGRQESFHHGRQGVGTSIRACCAEGWGAHLSLTSKWLKSSWKGSSANFALAAFCEVRC